VSVAASTVLVTSPTVLSIASLPTPATGNATPATAPQVDVAISLSAKAQQLLGTAPTSVGTGSDSPAATGSVPKSIDLIALLQQALGNSQNPDANALRQLTQLSAEIGQSNHDAARQKLEQLLKQFSILRLFKLSPRQLAELAREIAAAAQELASSGTGAGVGAVTSANDFTTATATTADASDDADSAAAPTPDTVQAADAAATQSGLQSGATDASSDGDQAAAASSGVLAGTADPSSPSSAPADFSSQPDAAQRGAILDAILERGSQNAAQAGAKAADRSLLQQAAAAVSTIQGRIKQAEDEARRKHQGDGVGLDQAAKTVRDAAATLTRLTSGDDGTLGGSADSAASSLAVVPEADTVVSIQV
jgi:hypothetical protein